MAEGSKMGMTTDRYGVSLGDDKHVLKLIVVIIAQLCRHTKNHWIVKKENQCYV